MPCPFWRCSGKQASEKPWASVGLHAHAHSVSSCSLAVWLQPAICVLSSPPPQPPACQPPTSNSLEVGHDGSPVRLIFYLPWTNPILGASFWAKVFTISLAQMQKGVTLQTPPRTYYYISCLCPLIRSSIHHPGMLQKWHLSFHQLLKTWVPESRREAVIFAWYAVCGSPCGSSSPTSPSSQVSFSTTVSPHRNPPEQPGESPCIHRLRTAHVLTITQIGKDTCPHTHTAPVNLPFHLCIN